MVWLGILLSGGVLAGPEINENLNKTRFGKVWATDTGYHFDLDEAFDATYVLAIPSEAILGGTGTIRELLHVSLGHRLSCGSIVNPRHVGACSFRTIADVGSGGGGGDNHSSNGGGFVVLDHHTLPSIVALKRTWEYSLSVPNQPLLGVRARLFKDGRVVVIVDFFCDAEMPRTAGKWTVRATSGLIESTFAYIVSIRTGFGCPFRTPLSANAQSLPADLISNQNDQSTSSFGNANGFVSTRSLRAVVPKSEFTDHALGDLSPDQTTISWIGVSGLVGWKYDLSTLHLAYLEVPLPHTDPSKPASTLELSLGRAVPCGQSAEAGNVLACLHTDGLPPVSAGLKGNMTMWRASSHGISLKYVGGDCQGPLGHMATWISLKCDRSVASWVAQAKQKGNDIAGCLFTVHVGFRVIEHETPNYVSVQGRIALITCRITCGEIHNKPKRKHNKPKLPLFDFDFDSLWTVCELQKQCTEY
jgi:hypothetical protein